MPLRANSSRQNLHISLTPDVLLWFNEILQSVSGQISGRLRAFRAKTIWHPMFSYVSWKCHFSQNIVFLRYNMKIGVISQGRISKNFCKHKIVFWDFCKNWNEMKWNECDFVIFENVAKKHSFTPDVSLCPIA